jgi:SAM-dependent methyltransferase
VPPAAAAASPSSAADLDGHVRRRSRRTVRIPNDAVPATPTPAAVAPVAVAVARQEKPQPRAEFYSDPGSEARTSQPELAHAPALARTTPSAQADSAEREPSWPDMTPAPPAVAAAAVAAAPRPAGGQAPTARRSGPRGTMVIPPTTEVPGFHGAPVPPPPDASVAQFSAEPAAIPPAPLPPPEDDPGAVIRPIRIIQVGSSPESERRAADLRAAGAPSGAMALAPPMNVPPPKHASRPPMNASLELEAFVAPASPGLPDIEEVDVDDVEPDTSPKPRGHEVLGARVDAHGEELESFEEIEPERVSDAPADEISVDDGAAELRAPAGDEPKKKAPPPPPKRSDQIAAVTMPQTSATDASRPAPPPPPPPARAPAAATAAASMPEPRKRQKPWWEELFGDDFLRTMDKQEPQVIKKECDFIEDRLGVEKGAVILDLACGPGVHAVELASRGYSVVGYDLSLAMLAHAADEAQARQQRLNFLQGDMREMAFSEMFDAVYSWSTSFGYFEDEKNIDVLQRIRRALRPGGVLLLDIANRDYISARQPSLVWFEGEGCVCMDEMSVDFFTSRLRVKRTVMFEDGRAREIEYAIRIYGLHELGKILHDNGFKVVEVTGHPAHPGVFFGSESPRIIILAERKE